MCQVLTKLYTPIVLFIIQQIVITGNKRANYTSPGKLTFQ